MDTGDRAFGLRAARFAKLADSPREGARDQEQLQAGKLLAMPLSKMLAGSGWDGRYCKIGCPNDCGASILARGLTLTRERLA